MSGRLEALFDKVAKDRGQTTEERVRMSFKEVDRENLPDWFVDLSFTPPDTRKVDCIIETTDVGKIWLQIKSSRRGVEEFRRRFGKAADKEAVVRIGIGDSSDEIREKVISKAGELRAGFLKERIEHSVYDW